jgi:NDP-sugar pyrophosphorylase family protein
MLPYTKIHQKSMIPVHGKPLLDYIITGIKYTGIKKFIIVIGHLKEQIIDYFQEGTKWNISIEYIEQEIMNGTGGAVLLTEHLINSSHFLTTYGDILVPYKLYNQVYNIHKNENEDFVLVSNYLANIQKGCSIITHKGYLINMVEKPSPQNGFPNWNNCGLFIFSKEIFSALKTINPSKRGEKELPDAILTGVQDKNWKVRVLKMDKNQFRGDFGDIKDYERLNNEKEWLTELES